MRKKTRLYFVTHVHGSNRLLSQILERWKVLQRERADTGGDITGMTIVPIISQGNGTYKSRCGGNEATLKSREQADSLAKSIRDYGFYPYFAETLACYVARI